jgi:hypothetical protein
LHYVAFIAVPVGIDPDQCGEIAFVVFFWDNNAVAGQWKERRMKLADIEKVNHLVAGLEDINGLIRTAEAADPTTFQLLIEAPGDASFKMSAEGASTSHSRGTEVSTDFLTRLKDLAVAELRAKREVVLQELVALGVDTSAG